MTALLIPPDPVEATARKAAERELRVVKEAMSKPDSLGALWVALNDHRAWMHRLIGGPSGPTWNYMTERFLALTTRGLEPDDDYWYLYAAELRITMVIIEGETNYAP